MIRTKIFNPLEALQNKPQAKKKKEIHINLQGAPAKKIVKKKRVATAADTEIESIEFEEEGEAGEDEKEEGENEGEEDKPIAPPRHEIKFVDKTADIQLNRQAILDKIYKNKIERSVLPLETSEKVAAAIDKANINIAAREKEIAIEEEATELELAPKPPAGPVKIRKRVGKKKEIQKMGEEGEPGEHLPPPPPPSVPAIEKEVILPPEPPVVAAAKPAVIIKKRGRKTQRPPIDAATLGEISMDKIKIGDTILAERLPEKKQPVLHRLPKYYMENRKQYFKTIKELFAPYEQELKNPTSEISCEDLQNSGGSEDFTLLTHQKIVRDYLNLYTPYRGLLLYHGLGSGKSCSSIAIAEGMKSQKQVYIMTPASLRMNFFSEMKKCGDELYKRSQYWEFISTEGHPEYVNIFSAALSLPVSYITQKRGVWMINVKKKQENFSTLDAREQKSIDEQIDQMIQTKYISINYNGLNRNKMDMLTKNDSINPFDNSVIVIDEAHNFVSRIVNKLSRKTTISYKLYTYLMSARNARIVLLSGTPIINYPNEIAVMFNILRGYIKQWTIEVKSRSESSKLNKNSILNMFSKQANFKNYDYVEFSANQLTITRNPFGFVNAQKRGKIREGAAEEDEVFERYGGVTLDEHNTMTDEEFEQTVIRILRNNNLEVGKVKTQNFLPLTDDSEKFMDMFVEENGNLKNTDVLKRRIIGLTSYFRSAQEKLLPTYSKHVNFHNVKCEMSPYQFEIYENMRKEERAREKVAKNKRRKQKAAKDNAKEAIKEVSSTYRVYSRSFCNFVFPEGIERPVPQYEITGGEDGGEFDEDDLDGLSVEQRLENADGRFTEDDADQLKQKKILRDPTYPRRIEKALDELKSRSMEIFNKDNLDKYSPKFLNLLENLQDDNFLGLHLIYSTFRTLEGIGILKLVLEENGFAQFKIEKNPENNTWEIIEKEEDIGKPKFAFYTGTESAEEKEIIRNIYNGTWNSIPYALAEKLRERSSNNRMGEIVKILMITAAGSEGINLRNTRYVHILEPYWHPVRMEQVIGRARRICSHSELPRELQTVEVFLYMATFTEEQKTDEKNLELKLHDRSRYPHNKFPITTDEYLNEICMVKENINSQILRAIKETAMDCHLYNKLGAAAVTAGQEPLYCYNFKNARGNDFASYPNIEDDMKDQTTIKTKKIKWQAVEVFINDRKYALRRDKGDIYDFNDYLYAKETGNYIEPVAKLTARGAIFKTAAAMEGGPTAAAPAAKTDESEDEEEEEEED